MSENTKNITGYFVIVLIIGFLFYLFTDYLVIKNKKVESCRYVSKSFSKNTYHAVFQFEYEGKDYTCKLKDSEDDYFLAQDKFLIQFDSMDPELCEVILDSPLISNESRMGLFKGRVISVKFDRLIFEYEINGKRVQRMNVIPGLVQNPLKNQEIEVMVDSNYFFYSFWKPIYDYSMSYSSKFLK